MIPLLKKLSFLGDDGKPTQVYRDFRNPDLSGSAMAKGIKLAYEPLYRRNEYAHSLTREKLVQMMVDVTGKDHDSDATKKTYTTFDVLRGEADFKAGASLVEKGLTPDATSSSGDSVNGPLKTSSAKGAVGINLGYTVNLNLPETTNIEVYNAIFKSLNEHFLKHE